MSTTLRRYMYQIESLLLFERDCEDGMTVRRTTVSHEVLQVLVDQIPHHYIVIKYDWELSFHFCDLPVYFSCTSKTGSLDEMLRNNFTVYSGVQTESKTPAQKLHDYENRRYPPTRYLVYRLGTL
jgi:hypothetical protein